MFVGSDLVPFTFPSPATLYACFGCITIVREPGLLPHLTGSLPKGREWSRDLYSTALVVE